ncbi:MAG: hypothetical protein ABSH42_12250 [Bryobacteraceae bacterium]|jgi:hypothetical protein
MLQRPMCAWIVLAIAGGAAMAADSQPWKDKQIAEWTVEEARQVLTESPWAKTVTPSPDGSGRLGQSRAGMGAPGLGIGGIGLGLPGMGRRGGMGRGSNDAGSTDSGQMPALTLRWISALPMSSALLITHEPNAPSVDEDHYAIAVYGVPSGIVHGDPDNLGAELKNRAAIKREGKKDMKPSSVEVLLRDDGPVIIYLFPRTNEITRKDKVEFDAEIGRLKFAQDFFPDEMIYQGKLEL